MITNLSKLRANLVNAALTAIKPTNQKLKVEDVVITNGSPIITSYGSTAAFGQVEVGNYITGPGIPANSYVTAKTADDAKITISANATASSAVTVNLDAAVVAGDVAITVAALAADIPAGTVLNFVDTTVKTVVTKTIALAGATSIAINSAHVAITDNTNAVVNLADVEVTPTIGTGNGVLKSFTATLPKSSTEAGIARKRVTVANDTASATETLKDDGFGKLVSDNVSNTDAGTIDYVTGIITAKFYVAPANGKLIVCDYSEGLYERRAFTNDNVDMTRHNEAHLAFWEIATDTEVLIEINLKPQNKTISPKA